MHICKTACTAQAEETGEHTQLLDDALYAMHGLSPAASRGAQLDSALDFAELAATQRGRLTLRFAPDCMTLPNWLQNLQSAAVQGNVCPSRYSR